MEDPLKPRRHLLAVVIAAGSSREARPFTVDLNWYPAGFITYYTTVERTTFEGGVADRRPEHAIVVRAQVNF